MQNVISFSLWGTQPKYVVGMLRNAELAPQIYPGWQCRVYCAASVPDDAVVHLRSLPHVRVVDMPGAGDWTGMFWRFAAAADVPGAVIFRDADSRLTTRERVAVDVWLASGHAVHVMRDHPDHLAPILGGMWGVRGGVLADLPAMMATYPQRDRWQIDQEFLAEHVWPRVGADACVHDAYFGGPPFPTSRVGRAFVGQPFDAADRPELRGPTVVEWRARQIRRFVWRTIKARRPRF